MSPLQLYTHISSKQETNDLGTLRLYVIPQPACCLCIIQQARVQAGILGVRCRTGRGDGIGFGYFVR